MIRINAVYRGFIGGFSTRIVIVRLGTSLQGYVEMVSAMVSNQKGQGVHCVFFTVVYSYLAKTDLHPHITYPLY